MKTLLPERIACIALSMVGRHEQPLGSNKGPLIPEFFAADYYQSQRPPLLNALAPHPLST
jgi:hypothetical protein